MAKTERILSNLPATFRPFPKPSVIYTVADAFGNELQLAENSLAAVMQAHWVDHADRGAKVIHDLELFAALYGLAPRKDENGKIIEDVEEFRERLKRYVRMFLEGTVTVQGILRVTAVALGLEIADKYGELDIWWKRSSDVLVTRELRGGDAAELIFGAKALSARGAPVRPAQITGTVNLSTSIDLHETPILRLKIDGKTPVAIDLASARTLEDLVKAINLSMGGDPIASQDSQHLTLASRTLGPARRLEVLDDERDAAPRLLGLLPRAYRGTAAQAAQVTSTGNPSAVIDLRDERYLRLVIDGAHLAEIDCAGPNPAQTTLDQVRDAINNALGVNVASHDGHRLTLASLTKGFNSSIAFQPPAAQDARARLFGKVEPFYIGRDAQPARVIGKQNLSSGVVDLSRRANIRVTIDNRPPKTINCAGGDPANTRLEEIVNTINDSLGVKVVSHDGRSITLTSPTVGPDGQIIFGTPMDDATADIFGIPPRLYFGREATSAQTTSTPDLSAGKDLRSLHLMQLAVDGHKPVEIDLRKGAKNPESVTLNELRDAINGALKKHIASLSQDGQHLVLTSPTAGGDSSLAIESLEITRRRRFVTRAKVTDEAAQAIFGFVDAEAQGAPASKAQLTGKVDLSRGIDLRETRFLRMSLDGGPAHEVDFASISNIIPRPRAATLNQIVKAINENFGADIASGENGHLALKSATAGANSRIAFEPPRSADALDKLLGIEPTTVRGQDGTKVSFVGTANLSSGIDLVANASIKLGIDGAEPVEIPLAGPDPAHKTLTEIMIAINVKLGASVATHDGTHLILNSSKTGHESQIVFALPIDPDVTKALFGIAPPRSYHGTDAAKARVVGTVDLRGGANLEVTRFLRLAVDGGQPVDVDCSAQAANKAVATIDEIKKAINNALGSEISSDNGTRLILNSVKAGFAGQITLERNTSGDARSQLLGAVDDVAKGTDPAPATITGKADLLAPVNLSERRLIRLAVDGGRPVDIDVAGAAPSKTFLDEIAAKINAVFPGLAAATDDDRLKLTSPTSGEQSKLSLLPLRYLELIEYPPTPKTELKENIRPGDRWSVTNDGAAETFLTVELRAPQGVFGPSLVNLTLGWRVRLLIAVGAGETARLWYDPEKGASDPKKGVRAVIIAADGTERRVPRRYIRIQSLVRKPRGTVLTLPRGRSDWIYMDCHASRFNQVRFDAEDAKFAGGPCRALGIFDVSYFGSEKEPTKAEAVFAPLPPLADSTVDITFEWARYQPGAFTVNLPADLLEWFGARFNEARFGLDPKKPELFQGAVTEPANDPKFLVSMINNGSANVQPSTLVKADIVGRAPIGWEPVKMPFRQPQRLTLGTEDRPAQIYLDEEGIKTQDGQKGLIKLEAREPGVWGNEIAVSARSAGSATFDVSVIYAEARFENAREVVLGRRGPLPALASELLQSGPLGVLQAKAAGVRAEVTRDRAGTAEDTKA